jgi:hypothetical protein
MDKQAKSHLNNVTMLALGSTVLLMSVRARDMMRDANELEERVCQWIRRKSASHTLLPNRIEWL